MVDAVNQLLYGLEGAEADFSQGPKGLGLLIDQEIDRFSIFTAGLIRACEDYTERFDLWRRVLVDL